MKVIIPVAGQGTRLLPHTKKRQKCLLPVAGKRLLDHILEPLIQQGFDPIVLVTGYLEEQIREYVPKFEAHFSFVTQRDRLGLGHAVFQGLENENEPVMIQLGDVIYLHDFSQFCDSQYHKIAVDRVPDPERFGIVELEGDRIVKVLEKPARPPSDLAIVGLYYVSSQKMLWEAIRYLMDNNIVTKGEIQLADAFQRMVDKGETIRTEVVSQWFDCGIPETFLSTNQALLTDSGVAIAGSTIIEPVSIGSACNVENSTIGPHVTIMDGCHIVDSEISDAIVLWDSTIRGASIHHAIVEKK